MDQERIKKVEDLLEKYYESDDPFEQTDLAIEIIQGHVEWMLDGLKNK